MAEIFRPPYFQVESAAGVPLSGAKLYFYVAGTTTDQAVYQEIGLSTQHTQPVVADASGIFPAIYLGASTYKAVLKTAADVEIKSYDNINATSAGSTVLDGTFRIQNTSDTTKQIAFSAAAITPGTTRTFTFPDTSGTVLTTGNTATDALALGATSSSSVLSPSNLQQERQLGTQPVNLGLQASVAASALTISLKGKDGADPSATNPVTIPFRNVTAATGTLSYLVVTTATSLVVSSGSTLGMTNDIASTLAIVAFNDAGTLRLGIINPTTLPITDSIGSSTAEGGAGAADSAGVFYTGTAVTSKAYTVIGYAVITEATAGTWASAPTTLQVASASAVTNAISPGALKLGTAVASTSGTAIDFTGIPAWAKKVTLSFVGFSTNGTSVPLVQLGDSGGVETPGYLGCTSMISSSTASSTNFTAGIGLGPTWAAAWVFHGTVVLTLESGATWIAAINAGCSDNNRAMYGGARMTLSSGPLDRVRITMSNGTDAFDAGEINISWE